MDGQVFTLTEVQKAYLASINALNGNNGGAKSKHWKNNGGELGEALTGNADGNTEPSNRVIPYGRA